MVMTTFPKKTTLLNKALLHNKCATIFWKRFKRKKGLKRSSISTIHLLKAKSGEKQLLFIFPIKTNKDYVFNCLRKIALLLMINQ
jgi:hypothetical protein